jgi:hypothetical protein
MALQLYRRHAKECEGGHVADSKADNLKRVAEVGNGAPA